MKIYVFNKVRIICGKRFIFDIRRSSDKSLQEDIDSRWVLNFDFCLSA